MLPVVCPKNGSVTVALPLSAAAITPSATCTGDDAGAKSISIPYVEGESSGFQKSSLR